MLNRLGLGAACAVFVVASPAAGQNYALDPTYGSAELLPGFRPDPLVVSLSAGGPEDAAQISPNCSGGIGDAPDFRLTYGSDGEQLFISVASEADTTLVVNLPDGSWFCDDDGGLNGFNPGFMAIYPAAGIYDIWVGSVDRTATPDAELHISGSESQ